MGSRIPTDPSFDSALSGGNGTAAGEPESAGKEPVERKLVAILAADVEGYSRLMHENEAATLDTLSAHQATFNDLIARFNGQVSASVGDSIVAVFASVTEAVNCAVAIQQHLHKANLSLPAERQMRFRIGINVGDIILKDGDHYGDDINVAARVEALAEAGGVCVTRAVRDQLRDRVNFDFEDLGERSVKNIPRPVRIFRVLFDPQGDVSLEMSERNSESAVDTKQSDPVELNIELAFWNSVKDSQDPMMFEAYLKKYPTGEFKALAEIQLRKLRT
jgi:class 3 adenylate cyclase